MALLAAHGLPTSSGTCGKVLGASTVRGDMEAVQPKVLSARLRRLAADGLVTREVKPTTPPTVEYALDCGHELLPAVDAIVAVGHRIKQRARSG